MLRPPRQPSLTGRDPALMAQLRELQAFAQQNQIVSAPGYRLAVRPDGTTLEIQFPPTDRRNGGTSITQMIVKQINDPDWLMCLPLDATGEHGTDWIHVAKPFELRFTPWDQQTIDGIHFHYAGADHNYSRRKATRGTATEIQIIARPWYVGETIYAFTSVTGGTGVYDFDDVENPVTVQYLDSNNAGRGWAQTFDPDPFDGSL